MLRYVMTRILCTNAPSENRPSQVARSTSLWEAGRAQKAWWADSIPTRSDARNGVSDLKEADRDRSNGLKCTGRTPFCKNGVAGDNDSSGPASPRPRSLINS